MGRNISGPSEHPLYYPDCAPPGDSEAPLEPRRGEAAPVARRRLVHQVGRRGRRHGAGTGARFNAITKLKLTKSRYHSVANSNFTFFKELNRTSDPGQGGAEGVPEPAEPRRLRPRQPALPQLGHQGRNTVTWIVTDR